MMEDILHSGVRVYVCVRATGLHSSIELSHITIWVKGLQQPGMV